MAYFSLDIIPIQVGGQGGGGQRGGIASVPYPAV